MFGAVQEDFQLLNGHCPKQLTPKKHLNGNGIVAHNNHQTTPSDTPNQKRCTAAPMKLSNCYCPAIVDLLCNLTFPAKVSRYRLQKVMALQRLATDSVNCAVMCHSPDSTHAL